MVLVVTLTVHRDRADEFRRFEGEAARIMRRHGGRMERVVVPRDASLGEHFQEIHLVHFPDDAAFAAYRDDPELRALAPLRESAVVATEIRVGDAGPGYGVE